MQPFFSPHSRFFSSLKQVEDRLASEESRAKTSSSPPLVAPSPSPEFDYQTSSPIFLDNRRPFIDNSNNKGGDNLILDSSDPPPDFLSTAPTPGEPQQCESKKEKFSQEFDDDNDDDDDGDNAGFEEEGDGGDDIDRLMSLLGLSAPSRDEEVAGGSSCDCSGAAGFYAKVAGVKGPKCDKERKRLDGWIEYYYTAKKEPARLAHLLLAKAAILAGEGEDGSCDGEDEDKEFGTLEFPVTVDEFLRHNPPEAAAEEQR